MEEDIVVVVVVALADSQKTLAQTAASNRQVRDIAHLGVALPNQVECVASLQTTAVSAYLVAVELDKVVASFLLLVVASFLRLVVASCLVVADVSLQVHA